MHSYLKSIGLSDIRTEADLDRLLDDVYQNYTRREIAKTGTSVFLELSRDFMPDIGICLCGVLDENGFHRKYYYPYYRGNKVSTMEPVTIEKRIDGESFAGVCDDARIGVSLIFYVQNPAAYFRESESASLKLKQMGTVFTCLAESGTVLFPVRKAEKTEKNPQKSSIQRSALLGAARNGDEEAIESLTVEEMDLYSMISRRVTTEDILSIVDTSFMPYGIECDKYQIIGTINSCTVTENPYTQEQLYQITVESNDMIFDICINRDSLLGEPQEGRRFKGVIWLQGRVLADGE